jgi:hypothetical protein
MTLAVPTIAPEMTDTLVIGGKAKTINEIVYMAQQACRWHLEYSCRGTAYLKTPQGTLAAK